MTTAAMDGFRQRFSSGVPFPHLQVLDFVSDSAFLRQVQSELLANEFAVKVRAIRLCGG